MSKRNKEIFEWREELAEEENIPPAFIFKNKYLKKLSKIQSNDKFAKKKLMAILGDNLLVDKFMTSFL